MHRQHLQVTVCRKVWAYSYLWAASKVNNIYKCAIQKGVINLVIATCKDDGLEWGIGLVRVRWRITGRRKSLESLGEGRVAVVAPV